MSFETLYPMTCAVYDRPSPVVTWTEVAPRITWLFVRTSPDDVRTMPVPAAPPPPTRCVSMTTTPVRGVLVAAATLRSPPNTHTVPTATAAATSASTTVRLTSIDAVEHARLRTT